MDADFPAAHSMDTHWFAVDGNGRVGLFFTSENGFLPVRADEAESHELVELWQSAFDTEPPGVDEEDDVEDWDEFLEGLVEQGLYYYNYVDGGDDPDPLLVPYMLWGVPEKPLHVGQLPPDWQKRCRQCVLGTAHFGEAEHLQPLEHTADSPIAYLDSSCAYLSGDEKTVRPVPGQEEQYRAFCAKYANRLRASRQGLRIEEPDEGKPT
jgi:hypothetical protein